MSTHDDLFLQAMSGGVQEQSSLGSVQKATVVNGNAEGWFLTTGGKSDVFLPLSETLGELKPGLEVEIVVTRDKKSGEYSASQKKALTEKTRNSLREAMENNTTVRAKAEKLIVNKEGQNSSYEVSINKVRAFLPMSQVRAPKDAQSFVGSEFDVVVLEIRRDRMGDRVVVSERSARERSVKENFNTFVTTKKIGDLLHATVNSVEEAFAILSAEGMSLFMHVTEFDWKYIKNLKELLKPGDTVDVLVQSIDTEKRSVKVSRKAGLTNPLESFIHSHRLGDVLNATVTRFARTLVIVESQEGAELVLPFSEMSWTSRVTDPKKILNIGDIVEVSIKEIDEGRGRVSVSLRDRLDNPWYQAGKKYAVGTKHQGLLTSITDFGIFLTFDDGIQGLVRKEDIDWSDADINLEERYKKGESITATVLSVEPDRERIRLGVKQLSANPYQNFLDNHPQGTLINVVVSSSSKDGLEVDVDGGLKAFIHVSQISSEHIEDARSVHKEGDSIKAVVRRVNISAERIELSIRDAERAQEKKEIDAFANASDNGPTTLGDIFKLNVPSDKPKKS